MVQAQIKIHYIQPFAVDKNIGRAYNEACTLIPDGDWICITDQDVMFLEPTTKRLISHALEYDKSNGRKGHDLYTCMTNRLAQGWQLYRQTRSNNPDITYHMRVAGMLRREKGLQVEPYPHDVAGFFMLFPKNVWNAVPFEERSITFDTIFADTIRRAGGSVGLMTGVYVFHLYRFGQANPEHRAEHLI